MSERSPRWEAFFPCIAVAGDVVLAGDVLLPPEKSYLAIFDGSYQYNTSVAWRNLVNAGPFVGISSVSFSTLRASANLGSPSCEAIMASPSRPRFLPVIPPTLSSTAPLILVGCLQA